MKYNDAYIQSKDIDWFFNIGGINVHVASAGGDIPDLIRDRDTLREIQYRVFNLPYIFSSKEIVINADFIINHLRVNNELPEGMMDAYIESFVDFARKGFVSLDRTDINDLSSDVYHVVCLPPSINLNLSIPSIPVFKGNPNLFAQLSSGITLIEELH